MKFNQPTNHIYKYISSWHAISTDIPDPLSPPFSIVHCFRLVFRSTSRIGIELLYVGLSWWRGPQEYITNELVPTFLAKSRMSGSSNLDNYKWLVVGDRTVAALWGAASRAYSILLAGILCSCMHLYIYIYIRFIYLMPWKCCILI